MSFEAKKNMVGFNLYGILVITSCIVDIDELFAH